MHKATALLLAACLLGLCACGPASSATQSTPQAGSVPEVDESESSASTETQESDTAVSEASEAAAGAEPDGTPTLQEPTPEIPAASAEPLPDEVVARMVGGSWQEGAPVALDELRYLRIPFVDFAGETQLGEMVVHQSVADEVLEIFAELYEAGYPLERMVLIDEYGADDLASMAANNSSGFCSRLILGTDRYSVHSYGAAVDINPVQNPYVTGGAVYPEAAAEYMDRTDVRPGMVVEGDVCYNAFTSRGWSWGGHWENPDYQHFEKP